MTGIAGFPSDPERLQLMHSVFDPLTWQHLDRFGPLKGLRVLDAGAGRGLLAKALWERIGPTGRLLAADLKPAHLADHGDVAYERRVVDLAVLDNVPEEFDLVFSRLALDHVAERDQAVKNLAERVAPGGTLFLQDLDMTPAMTHESDYGAVVRSYHRWCLDHGYDYQWIRTVPALLDSCGLLDVNVFEQVIWFRCGSPYARMFGATLAVHRDEMDDPAQAARIYTELQEGSGWLPGSSFFSVWGRRPA